MRPVGSVRGGTSVTIDEKIDLLIALVADLSTMLERLSAHEGIDIQFMALIRPPALRQFSAPTREPL